MTRRRVLALSVATGRVGYVYFDDGQPAHWGISHKAARSPLLAAQQTAKWLSLFAPDVVVTERVGVHSRKGALTKYLIAAVVDAASEADCDDLSVPRVQSYANKYEEADARGETMDWSPPDSEVLVPSPFTPFTLFSRFLLGHPPALRLPFLGPAAVS